MGKGRGEGADSVLPGRMTLCPHIGSSPFVKGDREGFPILRTLRPAVIAGGPHPADDAAIFLACCHSERREESVATLSLMGLASNVILSAAKNPLPLSLEGPCLLSL